MACSSEGPFGDRPARLGHMLKYFFEQACVEPRGLASYHFLSFEELSG